MRIPVYVVTGFLGSGKTTFLNNLLNAHAWQDINMLLIQFEIGEEEFHSQYDNCYSIAFPKKILEQQPEQIVQQIHNCIQSRKFDKIWIEWNGVVPFSQLQSMLLDLPLRNLCRISKLIHVADAESIENLVGRTGVALIEQIANCDFAVVRNANSRNCFNRIRRLIREINPGIDLYKANDYKNICRQLSERKEDSVTEFVLLAMLITNIVLIAGPVIGMSKLPVNKFINVFLGIILQAIPFLLIGILISSAIQIFIPQSFIERRFPKSIGVGVLVAILGGFCLPVCDCASIPIFKSLVRKGIPLPVAITFTMVTPVINPVVILSTYYAFNGNMTIVITRICFGIIAATIIGTVFAIRPPKGKILSGGSLDRVMCSCGCYNDPESVTTFAGKISLFLRHSQAEFFNVGKYLVVGTLISSIFQTIGTGMLIPVSGGTGLAVSIIIMMVMAFVLSLCSSSDAIIARSFANQFPMGAIMGFLVFGPMMDIKNVLMLSSGFSKRFIFRLLFVSFIACFTVVFVLFSLGGM